MTYTTLQVIAWIIAVLVVGALINLLAQTAADWVFCYFDKLYDRIYWHWIYGHKIYGQESKRLWIILTLRDYCSVLTYIFILVVPLVTYLLHLKNHWL